jgi:DNA end-binding protein Ku
MLVMEQLHYAGELKSTDEVPLPDVAIKDAELALARQLIDQASVEEFRPENYHDTVRERVLEAIQQKVEGQDITAAPAEAPQTKIIDLMDALKASLAKRATTAEKKPVKIAASKSAEDEPTAKPRKKAGGAR